MEFFHSTTRFDFMRLRWFSLVTSAVVSIACLVSLGVRGLNFGIDFTGGTLVEISYAKPVNASDVRKLLAGAGFDEALVQYFGTARDIMVRLPVRAKKNSAELSNEVMSALRKPYNETLADTDKQQKGRQDCHAADGSVAPCQVQMRRVEFVGPQVGRELAEKGGLAMLYALLGILAYVAWRFEWRFALGAVLATVHDAVFTMGMFSFFSWEFSLTVLAAVLAVIGYSLNDTIVVFDRIRENFRKMRKGTPVDIMNAAVNQTLSRTIMTSFATLLAVLALYFLGGEALRGFSLALIIGIVVGTYSSIFVASPLVLLFGLSREDMMVVKKEGAELDHIP